MHESQSTGFATGYFVAMNQPDMTGTYDHVLYMLANHIHGWMKRERSIPKWLASMTPAREVYPVGPFLYGFIQGFKTRRGTWLHSWDTVESETAEMVTVG